MPKRPIETAPLDGTEVTVRWTDADGVENESVARYRDGGWWVFLDSDTQKRVRPHSWLQGNSEQD